MALDPNILLRGAQLRQENDQEFRKNIFDTINGMRDYDLKRQKIAAGGDLPAPIQIVNEYEKAVREGDFDRANNISVFAKAFDKGIVPYAQGGVFDALSSIPKTKYKPAYQVEGGYVPPMDEEALDAPIADAPSPEAPLSVNDLQSTGDPAMDRRREQMYTENYGRQQNGEPLRITVRPGQYEEDALPKVNYNPTVMPGYGEAVGSIEAAKKGMGRQAEKDVDLNMNWQIAEREAQAKADVEKATAADIEREKSLGKGKGDKVIENNNTLSSLDSLEYSIGQAQELLPKVSMTGPIYGRIGNLAEEPDYKNLQGTINSITLQAKDLYNLGSGQGFTDADRDFLRDVIAGKYARSETIQSGLQRFQQALEHRRQYLERQNAEYGYQPSAPNQQSGAVSDEEFNAEPAQPLPNAAPKSPRSSGEARFNLKKQGFTDAQIDEYLKARGIQ